MLFEIDGDIFDCQFGIMKDLLLTIEKKLLFIDRSIEKSSDPVSAGLCDYAEYLIGAGFGVLQQQLHESLTLLNNPSKDAFKKGPMYSQDVYIAEVINVCANYWKHEPEWVGKKPHEFKSISKSTCSKIGEYAAIALNTPPLQSSDNYDKVDSKNDTVEVYLFTPSYPLSQIICKTTEKNECSFVGLLQHVEDWQKAVLETCDRKMTI